MLKTDRQLNCAGRIHLWTVFFLGLLMLSCGGESETRVEFGTTTAPIVAKAEVDRSVINISDKIRYTLAVSAAPGIEFDMPEFGEDVAGFAILDHGRDEWRDNDGRYVATQWYLLDTYVVDTYIIAPAGVSYTDANGEAATIKPLSVTVRVESLLDTAEPGEGLHDIKPPAEVQGPRTGYYIVTGIVLVVAVSATVVWLIRRRREKNALPPMPPWQIAYGQLSYLLSLELRETGEVGMYYVHLSDIVRHYIENMFGLRAPEMTTEEFLTVVSSGAGLKREHETLLTDFLSHCDMVKFAMYGPTESEMTDVFDSAMRFVNETAYGDPVAHAVDEVAA